MKANRLLKGFNGKGFTLFRWTGENRNPKKGEYFLSGAIPEVYKAFNDMTTPYNIMREATELKKRMCFSGVWYDLSNEQGEV